jgi:hypothetical protein
MMSSLSWKDYLSSDSSFKYGLEVLHSLLSEPSSSSSNVTPIISNTIAYEVELNILERYGLKELIDNERHPFEYDDYFGHDLEENPSQLIVDEEEKKPIFIMPYEDNRLLDVFFSNHEFFDDS